MDHLPTPENKPAAPTLKSYILGLSLSVLLTLASYFAVENRLLPETALYVTILTLALIQMFVQLVLFLHLGQESKPRLNFLTFLFMLSVLLIVVLGSLWIMAELNYNMMTPMK